MKNIRIVLCQPEGAINIGSVCRAMKTMGLSRLCIVNESETLDRIWLKKMALHAYDIYEKALFYSSLGDALSGTNLSAAITRRRGTYRKFFSLLPEEFAEKALSLEGESALVFGNEKNGLSDEEISFCNTAVHIPSHPDFPSLNLSHAVQVMTSTLWRASQGDSVVRYIPVDERGINQLVETIHETLEGMDYFVKCKPEETDIFFRDILARAALNKKEAHIMEKIFTKIRFLKSRTD